MFFMVLCSSCQLWTSRVTKNLKSPHRTCAVGASNLNNKKYKKAYGNIMRRGSTAFLISMVSEDWWSNINASNNNHPKSNHTQIKITTIKSNHTTVIQHQPKSNQHHTIINHTQTQSITLKPKSTTIKLNHNLITSDPHQPTWTQIQPHSNQTN